MTYGDPVPGLPQYGDIGYVSPPYGTPPPFPSHVFLDGSTPSVEESYQQLTEALLEKAVEESEPFKIDQHRIDVATDGAELVLDATPLGDIIVVPHIDVKPLVFAAPVKALKSPDNGLLIIRQILTDDGTLEWPIATFREWAYVYRADFVK